MRSDSPPLDVLFCLTGDLRANSRAIRQLDALTNAGLRVEAVGLAHEFVKEVPEPKLELIHHPRPRGSGPTWFWKVHRVFREHARGTQSRLYHASDLFALPALAQRAAKYSGRLTFDSREIYPQVGATAGKPWASAFWALIERRYISRADAVFTVNESISDLLAERHAIERPIVVPNIPLPSPSGSSDYLRRWIGAADEEPILLLQGYLKPGRGCELILKVMPMVDGVHLVFLGEGPLRDGLRSEVRRLDLGGRVHFHDLVPPRDLLDITASADLGICLIEPLTESLRLSLPNKLFEYLRAGVPVLGSPLPEIEAVIRQFDVGIVAKELTPEAVAASVQEALSDRDRLAAWRERTASVFETFDPQKASDAFTSTILQLLDHE